ncbi:MAG: IclR family transcriptional regulator [Burkholderiales bacterium]|nr:IclR family transcriptional regulator [Burkholderiales bacterium]
MMRAVERILGVFECFTPEADSLSLQEIADRIELPKSTTFRIVQSLEQAGYLVRLENQQYCLSFRFVRLAGLVKSTLGIREIARPIMQELSGTTKETVSLHTVSGRNRVCIDVVHAASMLRSVTQPGEQIPLLVGSAAKVLMAYMPQNELAPILTHIARTTKRAKADVVEELAKVRAQGYAVSHGERVLGVSAVSAPIKDVNEQVHYCISVNGPSVRVQAHEKEFVKLAVKAAANISRLYGAQLQA